jgi:hypothetical protein
MIDAAPYARLDYVEVADPVTLAPSAVAGPGVRLFGAVRFGRARLIDNGARFETYAIVGNPGEITLNGAAARLVHPGDKVIIITYADFDAEELADFSPRIVHVDEQNRPVPHNVALEAANN